MLNVLHLQTVSVSKSFNFKNSMARVSKFSMQILEGIRLYFIYLYIGRCYGFCFYLRRNQRNKLLKYVNNVSFIAKLSCSLIVCCGRFKFV